ncbi:MAG: cytochrome b [Rhodospirillaceae bacterium]|nr:cytochrome b [Rhodospirillaceae bacterium]
MHNTSKGWGWLAKLFHWVMALMIAVIVPIGFLLPATYQFKVTDLRMEAVHIVLSRIHQSMGLLILMFVVLRLGWRLKQSIPDAPAGLAAYQKILAKLNHAFLYLLMFLLPLSGWASLSAFGEAPSYFLWIEGLPAIVPKVPLDDTFGYSFFAGIHRYAVYSGAALLTLHAFAALWHQFVKKDSVLRRMWPLATAD